MIVVGTSDADMATAANKLGELGGGQIVVQDGVVVAQIELPIAGLMSNEKAQVVAAKAEKLLEAFETVGCKLNNANMQLEPVLDLLDKFPHTYENRLIDDFGPAFDLEAATKEAREISGRYDNGIITERQP